MADRVTKTNQVKNYLINHGSITSWDAIMKFKATRLSAIIYVLRERGMLIETQTVYGKDVNGNPDHYAKYVYLGEKEVV